MINLKDLKDEIIFDAEVFAYDDGRIGIEVTVWVQGEKALKTKEPIWLTKEGSLKIADAVIKDQNLPVMTPCPKP